MPQFSNIWGQHIKTGFHKSQGTEIRRTDWSTPILIQLINAQPENKKIHFGSANSEDYLNYKDPVRRDKYLTKAKKISNKDRQLTHQISSYPNYWSVNLLN